MCVYPVGGRYDWGHCDYWCLLWGTCSDLIFVVFYEATIFFNGISSFSVLMNTYLQGFITYFISYKEDVNIAKYL